MTESKHIASGEKTGVFDKYPSPKYRAICQDCGKGYHENRWDAHHILPGVAFAEILEDDEATGVFKDCLNATDYNINLAYSMAGLPKLTAFILFFQKDRTMPFKASKEKHVTMLRWRTVKQYQSDIDKGFKEVKFPGDFPVHNPPNWGHTVYNDDVKLKLMTDVFDDLRGKKKKKEHFKPKDLKADITAVKDFFWDDLQERGKGPGCGDNVGVEANLRARYSADNHGWWKPMCMADVPEPVSPK